MNINRSLLLFLLVAFVAVILPTNTGAQTAERRYLIDLGDETMQTAQVGWNNIRSGGLGSKISTITDTTGSPSSINLEITDSFWNGWPGAANGSGTTTSALYPSTATQDSFFVGNHLGSADLNAKVKLSGLNKDVAYTLRLYASRMSDDAFSDRTTVYTVQGVSKELQARNNVNGFAEFTNVKTTDGTLEISLAPKEGAIYGYLGVIDLIENPSGTTNPVPTPPVTEAPLPSTPENNLSGLSYQYFTGSWNFIPNFSLLTPVKTGTVPNIELSPATQLDNFGFSFKGFIKIDTAGTYNFYLNSDDGSKLYIDNKLVVNYDGLHSNYTEIASAPLVLSAGMHPIRVEFIEAGGAAILNVKWQGPGIARQLIPSNVLFQSGTTPVTPPSNTPPTVNAGPDQTSTNPQLVILTGSAADTDGSIVKYAWSKISGPSQYYMLYPTSATNWLNSLVNGTYVFRLTVTDNQGGTAFDDVQVTISTPTGENKPPTANAGQSQTISLPTTSVNLSGVGNDTDGTIASYAWSQVTDKGATITSPSIAFTSVKDLVPGTHTFRLTVTDNLGATATSDVQVLVKPLVVNTALTKKIVVLGSSTAAGTGATPTTNGWVSLFEFNYLDTYNPANSIVNLAISGYTTYHLLPTGTVNPANRPAVNSSFNITAALAANPDAIIVNMPSNDTANGYALAETQANYRTIATSAANAGVPIWFTTTQPRNLDQTGRNNLMALRDWIVATYGTKSINFWDTLANSDGSINATYNFDGVHVNNLGHQKFYNRVVGSTVVEEIYNKTTITPPPAPTVNGLTYNMYNGSWATLPNFSSLPIARTGAVITPNFSQNSQDNFAMVYQGFIKPEATGQYTFYLASDDGSKLFVNNQLVVNNDGAHATIEKFGSISLTAGYYYPIEIQFAELGGSEVLQLNWAGPGFAKQLVPTNSLYLKSDGILPPVSNELPKAFAGNNQVITLPTNTVFLSGSATDADGSISSYAWSKIGTNNATILSPNQASTQIDNLSQGTSTFRLTVTDNRGGTASAEVNVTVNAAPIVPTPTPTPSPTVTQRTLTAKTGMVAEKMYGQQMAFYESLPRGYESDPNRQWPLLIFMHGAGERGTGLGGLPKLFAQALPQRISQGAQLEYNVNGVSESFIVLMPQISNDWHPYHIDGILKYARANYRIDQKRIYLTGLSLGSFATTAFVELSLDNANQIAAIAPTDGAGWSADIWTPDKGYVKGNTCNIVSAGVRTWQFYGVKDTAWAWSAKGFVDRLNACNPPAHLKPKVTVYNDLGHYAWSRTYDTGGGFQNPNLYEWLLAQRRP